MITDPLSAIAVIVLAAASFLWLAARLVTAAAAITWATGAAASWWLLDIDGSHALLMGAIVIVSGPTVVIPRQCTARPGEPTNSFLRWESILIDPVGAGLALLPRRAIFRSGRGVS
jgi:NhaP-type Na+/H+ or K+/H+ antiporter